MSKNSIELHSAGVDVLQLNITRLCNQACAHCHVGSSPRRTEAMSDDVLEQCLHVFETVPTLSTLDLTGGAPELHPRFAESLKRASLTGRTVMVRHNLTVTLDPHPVSGAPMSYLPELFARTGAEVVCSLPFYSAYSTDRQRGRGVFEKSIDSLRLLNAQGYGIDGSGLTLTLMSNPSGSYLPPAQKDLEEDFKRELLSRFGVSFTRLHVLTNMPVGRFSDRLKDIDSETEYLHELAERFNPVAAQGVMCRSMVSVAYDGRLYDCDFNQMLDLPIGHPAPMTIFDFDAGRLAGREITVADHCLGCMAGAGSS